MKISFCNDLFIPYYNYNFNYNKKSQILYRNGLEDGRLAPDSTHTDIYSLCIQLFRKKPAMPTDAIGLSLNV